MFRLAVSKARQNRRRRGTSVRATDKYKLRGGLNLVDSVEEMKPGELLAVKNYEPHWITGAYARMGGHEVFDGQLRPHLAEYWKLELGSVAGGPFTVGETVTGVLSGSTTVTGKVAIYTVGAAGDETGSLILSELTSNIDSGSAWTGTTSGATGTAISDTEFAGEVNEDDHDTAQIAAELLRRNDIKKVGDTACSGPVRGANIYNNNVYAFRDNAAGTQGTMWKATSTGWVQVALGFKMIFNTGTTKPDIGDTITGLTSGETATVRRVVVTAGMWSGNDADGYIITEVISGVFTSGEDLQVGGATIAKLTSAVIAQALPVGGTYRFRNHNFGGNADTFRMYGVNGVGEAFEYDGTYFTLITSGMPTDRPSHVGIHRGHLLLGFPGGSVQHSAKNDPLNQQPVRGANELLAGDEVTGFYEEVGDVTFVFTRDRTFRIEGFVQENIQLKLHNSETGALLNTIQRIGRSVWLDDRGFTSLPVTDAFGDFASSQISTKIDPLMKTFLRTLTVTGSVIHRGKSLYRCFFSNKEAIVIGFSGNKVNGITTIDYGLNVTATANGAIEVSGTNNGEERVFVGADDGFVYETDVGRNLNGVALEAYIVPAYHFSGSPEYNKRYRRATIYAKGEGRMSLKVSADYDYNEDALNFEDIMDRAVVLGGGRYGISRHAAFDYTSASQSDIRVSMNSHARNLSLIFFHKETNEEPHTLYAVHFHSSKRRLIRS